MSYCVNCGVELADYIKKCPLCNTEVINPNEPYDFTNEPPYPEYHPKVPQKISSKTVLTILAIIFMLPLSVCVIADFTINKNVTWSGYVIAAIIFIFTVISSALVAHKESLLLEQLFDYMALLLLLVYIDSQTSGGWFVTFGLPVVGLIAILTFGMTIAHKVFNTPALSIAGIFFLLSGIITIACDLLINVNFFDKLSVGWSLYSFSSLMIIGVALIFIDKNKQIKRWLEKKFFI